MKVLLVSHSPGFVGGAERSLLEIARYLHEKPYLILRVVVPAHGELERQLKLIGVTCDVIPFGWGVYTGKGTDSSITNELGNIKTIRSYLESERPDVVMTNTAVIPWFAYACKQLGIPHTWFLRETIEDGDAIPIYPDYKQAMTFINSSSEHILVNSNYLKNYYSRVFGVKKNISVVYPGVDPKILEYAKVSVSGNAKKRLRLIIFSSISPNKNQLEVLRAIKALKNRTHDFHLTIMGPAINVDYRDRLVGFVGRNQLNDYVSFVEQTNDPYKVVMEQDICIVPSIDEPFGRVTVESMLLKKVVVASDSTGNREVAGDAPGTFLYKLGDVEALADRLYKLIQKPEGLVDLGQQAYDYALKKFLNAESMDLLYKVLKEAAVKGKPSGNSSWIDLGLVDTAKDISLSHRKVAEAEQKIIKERERAALQIQERDRLLGDMVNSKRWRFVSFLAKPLGWLR